MSSATPQCYGHIDLAMVKPAGTTGYDLDPLARKALLQEIGLDYNHGHRPRRWPHNFPRARGTLRG